MAHLPLSIQKYQKKELLKSSTNEFHFDEDIICKPATKYKKDLVNQVALHKAEAKSPVVPRTCKPPVS